MLLVSNNFHFDVICSVITSQEELTAKEKLTSQEELINKILVSNNMII